MNDDQALRDFVAKYARPYDPESDDYDRPPFAADIKEGKNDPIYNAHSYHTKVPPRGIIPYILHYTRPGDLILDPFCGSGMTGVAAQMCANPPADLLEQFPELKERVGPRHVILNDLSPAACHIAYNYNTPVDVDALRREFERIKAAVKDEFDWLYGTEHYEPAVGVYDPANADVASRLKNPPSTDSMHTLLGGEERPWELLAKAEVEARLGYPVTDLPRGKEWGNLDVVQVKQWICIPATIQYTIWSDVYRCEGFVTIEEPTGKVSTRGKNAGKPIVREKRVARGCGHEIVLWDAAVNKSDGEIAEFFTCTNPACQHNWKKINLKRCGFVPVVSNYSYVGIQQTKRGIEPANRRTERKVSTKEISRVKEISSKPCPYWLPDHLIDKQGPQYRRNALRARNIQDTRDFYTTRNLWALVLLWHHAAQCESPRVNSQARFCVTAISLRMTRMYRYTHNGKGGILTGSLYIPSLMQEMNVGTAFWAKVPDAVAVAERRARYDAAVLLRRESATMLNLPDSSVDYVFTDPPFGSNIYYSEASYIWESWLEAFTDQKNEAVVHRKNDGGTKRLPDYAALMQAAFHEMFRILKPGRWATVEFNNSDGAVFEAIKEAVRKAGFEIANMLLLDKQQKTFKQVKGAEGVEDVVDKDVLFNLHKPAVVRTEVRAEDHDLEQQLTDAVRQHLQTLPERIKADPAKYNDEHRTTATINSMLMNALIPKGVNVDRLNLPFIERVCSRYFRKVGQRWYLRGEAVGSEGASSRLIEEEVTVKDETSAIEWIRQYLKREPALIGELKPMWMRATGLLPSEISQTLVLEDLLSENFWRDADTNRWREPTDEEREQMNDDRSLRVLHDADRFDAGTLRRSVTDAEQCEWIEVLFKACAAVEESEEIVLPTLRGFEPAEAYRLIGRLFQSVLRDKVAPTAYSRAEKQARVASQRLSRVSEVKVQKARAKRSKDTQPTLFDLLGDT